MSTKFTDWKIGSSVHLNGENNDKIMSAMSEAGIKLMELSTDYNTYFTKINFNDVKISADKYGIELRSVHLPFSVTWDLSLPDDRADKTMECHMTLIPLAAEAGFKIAVVHPSSEPIKDEERPARLVKSKANLTKLAEYAKSYGMKLAVEDLPRTCLGNCSDDMLYLLADNPDLYVCFDLNHSLKQDNTSFINALTGHIITLHVSDYDFIDERHQLPLTGKNDWKSIISALENSGYNGAWLYETARERHGIEFIDLFNNYNDLSKL